MDQRTELKNEVDFVTRRNTVRSVVFNDYQEKMAEPTYDQFKVKQLANEITKNINDEYGEGFAVFGWVTEFIVEYILENNGTEAFGVTPLTEPVKQTRSVPEILNDLVTSHRVKNKFWFTN